VTDKIKARPASGHKIPDPGRTKHLEPREPQTRTEQRDVSRRTRRNGRRRAAHRPNPAPDECGSADLAVRLRGGQARVGSPRRGGGRYSHAPWPSFFGHFAGVLAAGGRRNGTRLRSSMATRQFCPRWASALKHAAARAADPFSSLKRGVRCYSLARIQALEPLLL
jgi:hypothetical protein